MRAGQKPIFVQTKSGTKLLSGTLAFFQLGTDGKSYYTEIGQRLYVDPVPVGVVFPSDRIGAMGDALKARPISFGWAPTPITKDNLAFRPSPNSGTQSYLGRSNKIGATSGGPVYGETGSSYYTFRRVTLDVYQKEIWADRKKQLEQLRSDERTRKLLQSVDELLNLTEKALQVASLLVPEARIGLVSLEALHMIVKSLAFATNAAEATSGDEAAFHKLEQAVLDIVFDQIKIVMPTWARVVSKGGLKQFELYRAHDEKTPLPLELRVPADDVLDQIYRFRCIVEPQLPMEMAMVMKNIADTVAKGPKAIH
jgi:hypothetical protein